MSQTGHGHTGTCIAIGALGTHGVCETTDMKQAGRKLSQLPLIARDGRWSMRFRGKRVDFVDRRSAVRAAIREAYGHSKNGSPMQVVCIDGHLKREIVWTYGVDPNPPEAPAEDVSRNGSATSQRSRRGSASISMRRIPGSGGASSASMRSAKARRP